MSTGTNAFDRNVSGNMIIIEMPCTAWALRPIVPTQVKIQASDQPATTVSRIAGEDAGHPAAGPVAHQRGR